MLGFLTKVGTDWATPLQAVFRFPIGTLPIEYLGVPLSSSRLSISDCRPLLEKKDRRIATWRSHKHSFAGRVQLIKSFLSAFHIYWLFVFLLPKGVVTEFDKRMSRFLWDRANVCAMAKVAWTQVCKPVDAGGLGVQEATPLESDIAKIQNRLGFRWVIENRLKHKLIWTVQVGMGSWSWRKCLNFGLFYNLLSIIVLEMGLPRGYEKTYGIRWASCSRLNRSCHGQQGSRLIAKLRQCWKRVHGTGLILDLPWSL
ncbi:UNVERIFIED_CONTAM: hypothetical protein Slati_1000500 [Sesamum latifolium]|uniref:Reverse transcriptase n=1 Tax=Sesamum latifolium TaxID=2727402 RepID=A0AAW2XR60_9LAMI